MTSEKTLIYSVPLPLISLHSVQTKLFNTGKAVQSCLLIVGGVNITVVIYVQKNGI